MSDPLLNRWKKQTCPLPPGSRVVIYARDSGGEEQERSVDQQLALYADYCKHFGLTIVETFSDRARSGASVDARTGFEALIAFLQTHSPAPDRKRKKKTTPDIDQVQGLLIWKLNRLGRNLNDAQFYKADLRRRGYVIISLADDIPDGDLGPVFEAVLDWKSERDLKDISSDAKRGLAALVTTQKADGSYEGFAPGSPPRGYKRQRVTIGVKRNGDPRQVSRWIPDPKYWARAQKAWAMRAAGASLAAIHRATHLYDGINTYTTFFRNKIYLGVFEFGELTLANFVPALCTPEQWEAVHALTANPRPRDGHWAGRHPKQRSDNGYLLSGLLKCSLCGSAMIGSRGSATRGRKRWRYYICSKKDRQFKACASATLSADMVEQTILDTLCDNILTLDTAKEIFMTWVRDLIAGAPNAEEHLAGLKEQHSEVKRIIANLIKVVEAGNAGPTIADTLAARERERADLETAMAKINKRIDPNKVRLPDDDQLQIFLARLRQALQGEDKQAVKTLLNALIIEVQASKTGGFMRYVLPIAPPPSQKKTPPPDKGEGATEGGIALGMEGAPTGRLSIPSTIPFTWSRQKRTAKKMG